MKSTLRLSLKPNEKIYLNGAVVRVDRKVTIELLNDVQFLLESHVLQAQDASTPMRQLYFIVQIMLMSPDDASQARAMFQHSLRMLLAAVEDAQILATLKQIDRLVAENELYEALKAIRGLYRAEADVLAATRQVAQAPERMAVGV